MRLIPRIELFPEFGNGGIVFYAGRGWEVANPPIDLARVNRWVRSLMGEARGVPTRQGGCLGGMAHGPAICLCGRVSLLIRRTALSARAGRAARRHVSGFSIGRQHPVSQVVFRNSELRNSENVYMILGGRVAKHAADASLVS